MDISVSEHLISYLEKSANSPTGGGLSKQSALLWDLLLQCQRSLKISGNIGEVGVWYGFSVSLCAMHRQTKDRIFLIDKYLRKEVLETIGSISGCSADAINQIQMDSLSVGKQGKLNPYFDSFRWFHIDGEHSYNAVMSDLDLAVQCVNEGGIIIVDDFFNFASASITEATFKFLTRNDHRVRMFCCGFNKAYLASPKYFGIYRDWIYNNILDAGEALGMKLMLAQNGWTTDLDYISIVPRTQNYKLQRIGKYCQDLEPLFDSSFSSAR
jgi:Methyltransferase domain